MTLTGRYASPAAVEAAIKSAAHAASKVDPSVTVHERIRLEYFHRFLSRVFSDASESTWVLKGGTSMLARVATARATTDVDLARRIGSLDAALSDLRRLAAVDLDDFFRFEYAGYSAVIAGTGQAHAEGYQVDFDVYLGAASKGRFHVDLVVAVTMTDDVEVATPANALDLPRLPRNPYRLYPVVDQIADKVCATLARYNGRPSTREKDLVDLLVLAVTHEVEAGRLRRALLAEAAVRALTLPRSFAVPAGWGSVYARLASSVPACAGHRNIAAARKLTGGFLDPVLGGIAPHAVWIPTRTTWIERSSNDGENVRSSGVA